MKEDYKKSSDVSTDEEVDLEEIDLDDYAIILDAEGNLKSILMPEFYDEIPEKLIAIFKLYGVDDIDEVYTRIGHVIH